MFKEHLKKALIDSKIDFESNKVTKETKGKHQETLKNKPNKPVKMSLDEFQKSFENNHKIQIASNERKGSKFILKYASIFI